MAGVIDTAALMLQMNKGFAVAGSVNMSHLRTIRRSSTDCHSGDAGHLAADNNGGSGAPNTYLPYLHDTEEVTAWIHDGISLFTQPAKTIIATFYSEAAQYSYYVGCSTGGAQGFALAQFHPDLFDGIVAGSPGNFYSHLALSFLWNARVTQGNSYISQDKLNIITAAVLDECDALDGVTDGVLENPLACTFNISSLTCQGGSNSSTCLTALQVEAAQAIYAGPQYDNGSFIYPGFDLGSEKEWAQQEASNESLSNAFAVPILQNLVYNNLSYNASTFDFQTDVPAVDQNAGMYIDEITTNLTTFASRGSKMLVTQGWADPYNAATWPIIHLEGIIDQFGGSRNAVSDFLNLFMIPGGGHCGAASNYPQVPATYHTIEKMVEWVERGRKPDWVLSTDPPEGNATKLLCPWPQTAAFVGGDASWWGSYVCEG